MAFVRGALAVRLVLVTAAALFHGFAALFDRVINGFRGSSVNGAGREKYDEGSSCDDTFHFCLQEIELIDKG